MSWRLAGCLVQLRAEIDDAWPGRDKASDGTIGDAAHATRDSDHNPWVTDASGMGVVRAIDVTHDPIGGPDADELAELFRALGRAGDPRVSYVIRSRRIASGTPKDGFPPWSWRPYYGSNPHDKHIHLSVAEQPSGYDSPRQWKVSDLAMPSADEIARATVRKLRATEIPAERGDKPDAWRFDTHVRYSTIRVRELHAWAGAHDKALEALAGAVAALGRSSGQQIDPAKLAADVRKAAEAGARAALESGVVDVDVTVRDREDSA